MYFINKIQNKVNYLGLKAYCSNYFLQGNLSDALIISAYPRGGSTWLSDVLTQIPRAVSYYEPLNLAYMTELKKFNFTNRHHIPQGSNEKEIEDFFFKLLVGKLNNFRMTFHPMTKSQNIISILFAKKRIYKFCRLNLMLPWLIDTFPTLPKPIVLFRHPCAVVASQMSFGKVHQGDWSHGIDFKTLLSQKYQNYFAPYSDKLLNLTRLEEQLAALWCISNKYVLEHPYNNKRWITLSYEELLINHEKAIKSLLTELKLTDFSNHIENYLIKNQLSRTSLKKYSVKKEDQLNAWKKELSTTQIDNIFRILEEFDITKYYNHSPEPNYKNLYNL